MFLWINRLVFLLKKFFIYVSTIYVDKRKILWLFKNFENFVNCNFLPFHLKRLPVPGLEECHNLKLCTVIIFEIVYVVLFVCSLFWLVLVCLGILGAVELSLFNWRRYQDNPTVISLERDYKTWNTSFPSVTICPDVKYDTQNITNSAKR